MNITESASKIVSDSKLSATKLALEPARSADNDKGDANVGPFSERLQCMAGLNHRLLELNQAWFDTFDDRSPNYSEKRTPRSSSGTIQESTELPASVWEVSDPDVLRFISEDLQMPTDQGVYLTRGYCNQGATYRSMHMAIGSHGLAKSWSSTSAGIDISFFFNKLGHLVTQEVKTMVSKDPIADYAGPWNDTGYDQLVNTPLRSYDILKLARNYSVNMLTGELEATPPTLSYIRYQRAITGWLSELSTFEDFDVREDYSDNTKVKRKIRRITERSPEDVKIEEFYDFVQLDDNNLQARGRRIVSGHDQTGSAQIAGGRSAEETIPQFKTDPRNIWGLRRVTDIDQEVLEAASREIKCIEGVVSAQELGIAVSDLLSHISVIKEAQQDAFELIGIDLLGDASVQAKVTEFVVSWASELREWSPKARAEIKAKLAKAVLSPLFVRLLEAWGVEGTSTKSEQLSKTAIELMEQVAVKSIRDHAVEELRNTAQTEFKELYAQILNS